MREAMASARVGDDVYGEDPTVRELEERAASLLGKEVALLVASGTMGNLVSILAHAARGEEAIVGRDAHTYRYEAGGMAALAGVMPRTLKTDRLGRMSLDEVEEAVQPDDAHHARTRLILLENSYGARNGAPIPVGYFHGVRAIADRYGLAIHIDGARFFNATTALGVAPAEMAQYADSVTFCLSKGLCAPVGSVVVGSADFIYRAHRARKILGGGMRQAGIIAAAGLVALEDMMGRLGDDHANAALLARGLAGINGIRVDPDEIQTNIVFFDLEGWVSIDTEGLAQRLKEQTGLLLGCSGRRRFRAVTHYWVGSNEVNQLLEGLRQVLSEL
jgi:threonine aldolase